MIPYTRKLRLLYVEVDNVLVTVVKTLEDALRFIYQYREPCELVRVVDNRSTIIYEERRERERTMGENEIEFWNKLPIDLLEAILEKVNGSVELNDGHVVNVIFNK